MPLYVSLGMLAALVGFFVWLFRRRARLEGELYAFMTKAGFRPLDTVPPDALEAKIPNAQAFSGQIDHAGRRVEFLFLSGWTTSTSAVGTSSQTTIHVHHAVILPANDANFRVEARCRKAMESMRPLRDFFVFNTLSPQEVKRLSGHRLLITWNGLHTAKVWRQKLDFLRSVLD
jgi:hypothetical protein